MEIRLGVAQPPAYLRHEMTVSIDIETGNRGDTLSIPCDSVRDIDRNPWVMGVREGRTVRQSVKLGLRGAGRCEIVDGLNADDAVLAAANPIGEGRRVVAVHR